MRNAPDPGSIFRYIKIYNDFAAASDFFVDNGKSGLKVDTAEVACYT